jgi:hypothetical protein
MFDGDDALERKDETQKTGAGIGEFSTRINVSEQSANINLHLSCACDIDRSRGFNYKL